MFFYIFNQIRESIKSYSQEFIHSYFEDEEPDVYFKKFEILYKEKRLILEGKYYNTGRTCILDYIVKKQKL